MSKCNFCGFRGSHFEKWSKWRVHLRIFSVNILILDQKSSLNKIIPLINVSKPLVNIGRVGLFKCKTKPTPNPHRGGGGGGGVTLPPPPLPGSSMSGVILFRELFWSRIKMLTLNILGWTRHFDHFSKWPPQNPQKLHLLIYRLMHILEIWFWWQNPHFLGQGIQ